MGLVSTCVSPKTCIIKTNQYFNWSNCNHFSATTARIKQAPGSPCWNPFPCALTGAAPSMWGDGCCGQKQLLCRQHPTGGGFSFHWMESLHGSEGVSHEMAACRRNPFWHNLRFRKKPSGHCKMLFLGFMLFVALVISQRAISDASVPADQSLSRKEEVFSVHKK